MPDEDHRNGDHRNDGPTAADPAFERATPVLRTADYPRARAYYEERLGFQVVEEGGDPPRFGIFKRGGAVIFVDGWHGGPSETSDNWNAYIHVAGLDALFERFRKAGAEIVRPIEQTVYGMREFELLDPDGNRICFGEDLEPAGGG